MTEAIELLRELAIKLGTTVELLWPPAVRYVAVYATCVVTAWLSWFVVNVGLLHALRRQPWILTGVESFPSFRFFAAAVLVITTPIGLGIIFTTLPNIIEPVGSVVYRILN